MSYHLLSVSVHELELPVRLAVMLDRKEIYTLGKLVNYSAVELTSFGSRYGLDRTHINLIESALQCRGLKLRRDP